MLPAIHSQMSTATVARREAEHMLTRAQEQLQVAKFQFDGAIKEIEHTQQETDALDKEQQGQCTQCKVTSKGASIGDKDLGH